jgi:hypothetical protein
MKRFIETSRIIRQYQNGTMVGLRGRYMSKRYLLGNVKASLQNTLSMSLYWGNGAFTHILTKDVVCLPK